MTDVGPLLALVVVVGALCLIVGARQLGQRLVVGGFLAAVFLPAVFHFVGQTSVCLGPVWSTVGWLLGVFVVVTFVAGWLAYLSQRRRLAKWREPDQPKLGLKKRIDPE